jgi:putative transposase
MFESRTDLDVFQLKAAAFVDQRIARCRRRLLEQMMEAERNHFLGCGRYERSTERRGYRNGYRPHYLQTTCGSIRLRVPRVRDTLKPWRPRTIAAYQRRTRQVDRIIAEWVACGVSTREVSRLLEDIFGATLSPGTVSRVVGELDEQIRAFHTRRLTHGYRYLYLDGKHCYTSHLRRRRGRGKKKEAVLLLAWGVRHDGTEELAGFRAADSESEQAWTDFLTDLWERGLRRRNRWAQTLDMIVTDGDMGLRGALFTVYPTVPKQRCVFHKVHNIADHLRERSLREAILSDAAAIYEGLRTRYQARYRMGQWAERWREAEPEAVSRFSYEFEDTLTYLNAPPEHRRRLKTTNPIERLIRELNKKIRRVGIFPSAQSLERAAYLIWRKLQRQGYGRVTRKTRPKLFTPNS